MPDENEDTLLASMKEAIAEEKSVEDPEKEQEADKEPEKELETAEEPEKEQGADEDEEPTRGQTRHQKLANELREAKEERARERKERDDLIATNARKDAELEQYRRQQTDSQTLAQRQAEERRLELLDPAEKAAYHANQKASHLEQRLNQIENERRDDRDRSDFRSRSKDDPMVEKYADRVEEMRQEDIKKLGVAAPRDAYLNFIVGEAIRKDASAKLSAKKDAAGKRISSVTSQPASARGDVSGTRSDKGDSLEAIEARLRNVTF